VADLRWMKPPGMGQQLNNAVVPNGTEMVMQASNDGRSDGNFRVLRAYTPIARAIRAIAQRPKYADQGDVYPAGPAPDERATLRSAPFQLTAAGQLHTHRWVFRGDGGEHSTVLRTSRFVDVSVGGKTPPIPLPHIPVPVPPIHVDARVAAPKDPSITLSIVSPFLADDRCSFDQVLDDVLREIQIDSEPDTDDTAVANALLQYRSAAPGWEVWLDSSFRELEVGDGDQVEFTVNVSPGSVGSYPFAVVAADKYSEEFSVSNVVVAQLDEQQGFSLLFGDNDSEDLSGR
jgi:hypothetical protein